MDLQKNLIERRMMELDPELATHYLKYNTYKSQRAIRGAHVFELSNKMTNGLFRAGGVAFATKNGEREIMMNGQHVCSGVIHSGVTVPCQLERFKVHSELELSELFRQFEILSRSLNDMVKAEADSLGLTWPQRIASLTVSAAAIHVANKKSMVPGANTGSVANNKGMSKDIKVMLLRKYLKEGSFLNRITPSTGKSKHILKTPIVSMIFKTYWIDESAAYKFWMAVRSGENLTGGMPEMKVRDFLIRNTGPRRGLTSNHEFCYRIAQGWNAYRRGKSTVLKYHYDKAVPSLV